MKFTLKEIILIGIFAALTGICAQISIPLPFSPVPITLSLFAVFMSAVLLGPKCGAFSQLIYVLIGICGIPVFAGFNGGIGIILGPKGGYIISYPIIALIIGLILKSRKYISKKDIYILSRIDMIGAMVIGLIICYSLGATWLGFYLKKSIAETIAIGVAPYLLLDLIKIVFVSIIAFHVQSALIKAKILIA